MLYQAFCDARLFYRKDDEVVQQVFMEVSREKFKSEGFQ